MTWFKSNKMRANANKCHLLVNSKEKLCAKIGPCHIKSSEQQKLPRVLFDNESNNHNLKKYRTFQPGNQCIREMKPFHF